MTKQKKGLGLPNSVTLTSDDKLETETTMDFKHNLYIVKIGGKEVLREPLSGRISHEGKDMLGSSTPSQDDRIKQKFGIGGGEKWQK